MSLQNMAKRFISETNVKLSLLRGNEMMIVNVGYQDYVLPTKDAITLLELLSKAERYGTGMYRKRTRRTQQAKRITHTTCMRMTRCSMPRLSLTRNTEWLSWQVSLSVYNKCY